MSERTNGARDTRVAVANEGRRRGKLRGWLAVAAIGLGGPGLATLIALALPHAGIASAACLYLLATAAAAALGRSAAGMVAAACGFLGLNYFFTAPTYT